MAPWVINTHFSFFLPTTRVPTGSVEGLGLCSGFEPTSHPLDLQQAGPPVATVTRADVNAAYLQIPLTGAFRGVVWPPGTGDPFRK